MKTLVAGMLPSSSGSCAGAAFRSLLSQSPWVNAVDAAVLSAPRDESEKPEWLFERDDGGEEYIMDR